MSRALLFLLIPFLGCSSAEPSTPAAPRPVPPRPAPSLLEQEDAAPTAAQVKPESPSAPPAQDALAGTIAGQPLSFAEIVEEWHAIAPREVFLTVEKLVAGRLAEAEAARLGVRLDPEVVQAEADAQVARFKADLLAEAGAGADVEKVMRETIGIEPERHWERIREGVIRQMLAERAVRAWELGQENATVRLIVLKTEEEARAASEEIQAGADFAEVARERSVDESGERGGLIPFLVRQEGSPLARVVFTAADGEVVGPVPAAGHHFLVRVEERRPGIDGLWPELVARVEASLRDLPVEESEFLHWKLAMERLYSVDLRPLLQAIGAPQPKSGSAKQ